MIVITCTILNLCNGVTFVCLDGDRSNLRRRPSVRQGTSRFGQQPKDRYQTVELRRVRYVAPRIQLDKLHENSNILLLWKKQKNIIFMRFSLLSFFERERPRYAANNVLGNRLKYDRRNKKMKTLNAIKLQRVLTGKKTTLFQTKRTFHLVKLSDVPRNGCLLPEKFSHRIARKLPTIFPTTYYVRLSENRETFILERR